MGACANAGPEGGLTTSCGARVEFWADMALVAGLIGGLLSNCLKNLPTTRLGVSDKIGGGAAIMNCGETTKRDLEGSNGV
jgi:hypothetical protein